MLNQIDLTQVDLNLMVLFDVVMTERHVGRAAGKLHLSPSAVSHGLGRLRRLLHDPLFLKHPKGMVPTARAVALAEPIAVVLEGARGVIGGARRFEPRTSTRRFVIGAPDAISAVMLPRLLATVRSAGPEIDLSVRHVQPPFDNVLPDLDARTIDVAVMPHEELPARFAARPLFDERFVVVTRRGHALGRTPSLARYCAEQHLLVSPSGHPVGHVDQALARQGARRRVVLAVPNFMLALAILSETDLVAALPQSLIRVHARRFGLVSAPLPVALPSSSISAIAPQVALADAGLAWLLAMIEKASPRR